LFLDSTFLTVATGKVCNVRKLENRIQTNWNFLLRPYRLPTVWGRGRDKGRRKGEGEGGGGGLGRWTGNSSFYVLYTITDIPIFEGRMQPYLCISFTFF
jgi:hypothetical protein